MLRAGTRIAGGVPGQSNYYTTYAEVQKYGPSRASVFQALQVKPHTLANPQYGSGGAFQYFLPK